jgi:hypothetical protein
MLSRFKYPILILSIISVLISSQLFAKQSNQKILQDFFMGKWGGNISGEVVDKKPHQPVKRYPFNIELVGYPAKLLIGPYGGGSPAWMMMEATWPGKFTIVYDTVLCGVYPVPNGAFFNILFPMVDPATITEIGYNTIFFLSGFTVQIENKNLIRLTSGGADNQLWEDSWAKGELHKVKECTKKDTISLDILLSTEYKDETKTYPNGTKIRKTKDKLKIVTKDGCVELYMKEYFKINGSDGTEFEMLISKALDGTISSNFYKGSIQVDIWKEGKHHHFFTRNAIVEVSGTNFTMEVSENGTTTLTVLDGEVEFSDKAKKKTVIVKKNQRSDCKPGGLPIEPMSINPDIISKWYE